MVRDTKGDKRVVTWCGSIIFAHATVCPIRVLSEQPEKREILDVIASDENRVQFGNIRYSGTTVPLAVTYEVFSIWSDNFGKTVTANEGENWQ